MIELLSPAKNLTSGKAAILSGADAVYIGAGRFGARAAAGNSIQDINELAEFAHQFFAKVYVTVNTVIYEDELKEVRKLIHQLYDARVDAIIIQDPAILQMKLPPIALHASTQMHNNTPERVKFLEDAGLSRVVLARELTLEQIREIRQNTAVELEAFIHGSLCVSYSGRCYLSENIGGRSANRGECAQPCRNSYTLTDEAGNVIVHDSHPLSLRDLNLSSRIGPMIDAGITSFKIEGRLKDIDYVRNITAYYRQLIDSEIAKRPGLKKASSGTVFAAFTPDPERSFNRGYTEYFIDGRKASVTNSASPKSEGKILGTVVSVIGKKLIIQLHEDFLVNKENPPLTGDVITNGDGICWYNGSGKLIGTRVNVVKPDYIIVNDITGLEPGMQVMRNYDKAFADMLNRNDSTQRSIDIKLSFKETADGFALGAIDEDGIVTEVNFTTEKIPARTPDIGYIRLRDHLMKAGSTVFSVSDIQIDITESWFFQSSVINSLRRELMDKALEQRFHHYHEVTDALAGKPGINNDNRTMSILPVDPLTGKENITNSLAEEFYTAHGVTDIDKIRAQKLKGIGSAEKDDALMTTKMCLKYEIGKCPTHQHTDPDFPKTVYLSNRDGRFRLSFDCKACVMRVHAGGKE